jgi:hypothetical protein
LEINLRAVGKTTEVGWKTYREQLENLLRTVGNWRRGVLEDHIEASWKHY